MWTVNWLIDMAGKIQSKEFPSKGDCLDFLEGFGLGRAFLSDEVVWWISSPEGQVHLR